MVLGRRLVIGSRGYIVKEHVINQERRQGKVTLAGEGYSVGGMLYGQEGILSKSMLSIKRGGRGKLPLPAKVTR